MLDAAAVRDSLVLDAGAGARRSGGRGPGSNKFGASSIRGEVFAAAAAAGAVEPLRQGAALLQSLIMFFNTGLDVWVNYGLFDR